MIGDLTDTLTITTLAVNRNFVRKSRNEASTFHSVSYSNIYTANHAFKSFAILQPNASDLNSKQRRDQQHTTNNSTNSDSYSRP